ncbi:hypothetical protein BJF93_14290 [Xaviernesmea oryzae]|uniref:DUF5330 domain-containing protein n=1 Tax=Xaviernesmea oryzae TaxID=464029 RepID=A0A1Q9ARI6_9HYPH|nr:DUF5330 domain-containing protein [Xaviernesmea oryzae]OLP57991.1 hypothetical protein BJF93_14290 [Xaviernesmea oryzae]SEL27506.1 hypothetical protein SAMN04487976_1073 [Xaviernesmea oryzae]
MWFLIKGSFWFALVLVLLPFVVPGEETARQDRSAVDMGATVSAATEALTYISALCVQKPDVCDKGAETVNALGQRARDGARIAYEFLDHQFAGGEATVTTGTIAPKKPTEAHEEAGLPALKTAPAEDILPLHVPVPAPRIAPASGS